MEPLGTLAGNFMVPHRIAPLSEAFRQAIVAAVGRKFDPRSLSALVERVSRKYSGESQSLAKGDELAARALFFLPRDVHKVVAPIAELARNGALPDRPLAVLDVGAGVGASSLGALLALASVGARASVLECVDEDREALALLRKVFDQLERDGLLPAGAPHPSTRDGNISNFAANHDGTDRSSVGTDRSQSFSPSGSEVRASWDLILVSNVCTEALRAEDVRSSTERDETQRAERIAEWLAALAERAPLSDDGAIVLIEPATQREARTVQRARDAIEKRGLHVFGPCTHGGACPLLARERDWCHDDIDVDLPVWLADIARGAGLRYQGLTYSYLTVRKRPGRLAHNDPRVRDGAWVSARLVSGLRPTKGKTEAFVCVPEPARGGEPAPDPLRAMQLDRVSKHAADDVPKLGECTRGELVAIDRALVPNEGEGRTVRLGADDWARS